MKRWVARVLCLCLLLLCGCISINQNDLAAEKKDYLEYALGEHRLEREKLVLREEGNSGARYGYLWRAHYRDFQNREQEFRFDNLQDFDSQLLKYAAGRMEEQVKAQLLNKHFSPEEQKLWQVKVNAEADQSVHRSEISDSSAGLRLKELTPAGLHNDWQVAFAFSAANEEVTGEEQLAEIKPRLEALLREAMELLEDRSLTLEFTGQHSDGSFELWYRPEANYFFWTCRGDLLDQENTVDGKLTVVRRLYIGDRLIMDSPVRWSTMVDGEYHLSTEQLMATLQEYGVSVEEIESVYRWQMGDSAFELNQDEGTLKKDGQELLEYALSEHAGIPQSVFGEITGTTVEFDEYTNAIYVRR